ncbi:unnamed protein product [Brugia pahangi]|uniref:Integral membrane protein n=1 Tax=Brugia pahangi TaxID=6280 RepID=A0A0N4SZN7_BRUPA|nr:unnamed protein product [Brugia pahangi]
MWIHEWCHISVAGDFTQFFMNVAQICPQVSSPTQQRARTVGYQFYYQNGIMTTMDSFEIPKICVTSPSATAQLLSKIVVPFLMVPFLVSWLVPRNTVQEWRLVVLIIAVAHIVADIMLCTLYSDKPEYWHLVAPMLALSISSDLSQFTNS